MKCEDLDPNEALKLWPEMEPLVARALAYDIYATTTPDKLRAQVETGYARVLACFDGPQLISATVTQLYKNINDERILHIVCTAGTNADEWLGVLHEKCKEIAADQDCAAITLAGRPGWVRKLKQYGYKTDQVIMRVNNNGKWRKEQIGEQPSIAAVR